MSSRLDRTVTVRPFYPPLTYTYLGRFPVGERSTPSSLNPPDEGKSQGTGGVSPRLEAWIELLCRSMQFQTNRQVSVQGLYGCGGSRHTPL